MKRLIATMLCAIALSGAAWAGPLTPILMANGEAKMICDGQWRWMYTVQLDNQLVVGSYLSGNLITDPNAGADVIIWSPVYGGWGGLGDLHNFPTRVGGGRVGDRERMFPAGDGVLITGPVHVGAACWGGGTLEIYAQIWVRRP